MVLPIDPQCSLNLESAIRWASNRGGVIPNNREHALIFANIEMPNGEEPYWSFDQQERLLEGHKKPTEWAFCQRYDTGQQELRPIGNIHRVVAIRKVV